VSLPAVPEIEGLYVPAGVTPFPPLVPVAVGPLQPIIADADMQSMSMQVASANLPIAFLRAGPARFRADTTQARNTTTQRTNKIKMGGPNRGVGMHGSL
jgi:hypothetical protein